MKCKVQVDSVLVFLRQSISIVSVFRSEIPTFCPHSSSRHQTWQPACQQQLCSEGKHLIPDIARLN